MRTSMFTLLNMEIMKNEQKIEVRRHGDVSESKQ